ncbi:MAG: hypothetical protein AAFX79_01825 [Planctomycetota bacterium]
MPATPAPTFCAPAMLAAMAVLGTVACWMAPSSATGQAATRDDGGRLAFVHERPQVDTTTLPPAPGANEDDDGTRTEWHFQFEPQVRFTGPGGEIRLPGGATSGTRIELEDINLDSPRLFPGFDASIRRGPWRFNVIGLFYDTDGRGAIATEDATAGAVVINEGDRTVASHSYTQLDFRLARTVSDIAISPLSRRTGHRVRLRTDAEVGVRVYDLEFAITNEDAVGGPATVVVDEVFIEPHAGVKAGFNIVEDVTIDLYTNFGLFPFERQAFSWDIGVGFQWRPVDHVGVQIGYRSTIFLLQTGSGADEFEWAGSYQGLYAGLAVRF